ncbi:MAG: type II toxin-antitoxin system RelE/ParE family toxin [Gammaproteobacteria bacterium]
MSLPVVVRPLAEQDLFEAWYDDKSNGLGTEFRAAVDALLQRISESPLISPLVYGKLRRAVMHRFPYLVYYLAGWSEAESGAS